MFSKDVAVRSLIVLILAGSVAVIAGIYEVDRREKSTSETVTANVRNLDQRVQVLADEVRILSSRVVYELNASEKQVQVLGYQVQTLESQMKELENQKASASPRQ